MPLNSTKEPVVISLGGSLVSPPTGPDAAFLAGFIKVVSEARAKGMRFYIIVGGGNPARLYQSALADLGFSKDTQDYMGIFTTHLNAHFVALAFGLEPSHKVVLKPENLHGDEELHVTGAGLQPGQSSDAPTVETAIKVGATRVFNLSNVSQVYTGDPKTDPNAQPIERISWDEYLEIIPSEWDPGLSTPFDPVASRLAAEHNIAVSILGPDLNNLASALAGHEFYGSTIG